MKILIFMEATVVNGAAKSILNFCDTLAESPLRSEISVELATFHRGPTNAQPNQFAAAVQSRGIPIHLIPETSAFDLSVLEKLRDLERFVRPDIIHTNNVKSHALVALAHQAKWIAMHHGYTATDFKMRVYNQCDRFSLRRADRVITVCAAFREQLRHAGIRESKMRVLHNSVSLPRAYSPEERAGIRQQWGIQDGERVLISVGRFSREKGHTDLIRALSLLKAQKWKLLLVGSGPERENIAALTNELGLSSRVVFTGQQSDVAPFYAIADLMPLPSHSEGSPHVVLEAMAARVPIAATRVGGVPEILADEETALLVPSRDPAAMAGAVDRLLGDAAVAGRLTQAAYARLLSDFSHEAYLRNLLSIYSEVAPI